MAETGGNTDAQGAMRGAMKGFNAKPQNREEKTAFRRARTQTDKGDARGNEMNRRKTAKQMA
jgi:hypothetical protein